MDAVTHEAAIRQRAYAIWEEEGRPQGREWDHWERASQEILMSASTTFPKPRKVVKGRARATRKMAAF